MGQKQSAPAAAPPQATESAKTLQSSLNTQRQSAQTASVLSHNNEESPHNFGQPIRPPHKKKATDQTEKKNEKSGASKLVTDCRIQQRASLKCIEENYQNKDTACAEYFEAYKQCRRDEHQKKLEANAKNSGGGGGIFG